jgi:glycosyltransferase involved in cell wall biosynthesis
MVDEIVVPSQYLQRVFAEHGYQTRVIRNIIDTSSFRYRQRKPLRANLLSTRNLESHYGIENTLQAFAIFKKRCPDALLTIAGYGRERDRLQRWVAAQRLDGVSFIGRIEPEAMPRVYDQADIFLNSSTIDNQPVSILEAFAAGLAVVSTPTGDIPSMVRDQSTGLIVPHNDPQAMADAICLLLQHPQQTAQMTDAAREEVEKYTWGHVCDEWEQLYQQDQP